MAFSKDWLALDSNKATLIVLIHTRPSLTLNTFVLQYFANTWEMNNQNWNTVVKFVWSK